MTSTLQEHFGDITTSLLQEAYTFTGPSDALETIWIYFSSQDGGMFCEPVYSVAGKVFRAYQADDFLPEPVNAPATHGDLSRLFGRTAFELSLAFEDSDQDEPTRVIIRYDIATQAVNSEFRYEPLEHDEDNDTWADVFVRWVDRLRDTRNDSA